MPILENNYFTFEIMKGKSIDGAFLYRWVINIVSFSKIYKKVNSFLESTEEAENLAKLNYEELQVVKIIKVISDRVDALKQKLKHVI